MFHVTYSVLVSFQPFSANNNNKAGDVSPTYPFTACLWLLSYYQIPLNTVSLFHSVDGCWHKALKNYHHVQGKSANTASWGIYYHFWEFNHATADLTLAGFHQAVDCPTRNIRTIVLLYAKVRDAYRVITLPPVGKSDQNPVYLQPLYRQLGSKAACYFLLSQEVVPWNGICPHRLLKLHRMGCPAGLTRWR